MSGLAWTSNFTFPVYAVGDGLFMDRVMNAVAALSNSGVLASLALLGFLMGLLMVVIKAMSTGGRDVELPSIFTSLILYALMFGGTARVMINDVGTPAGKYANATYVVDHVPFGMAVMGWMVSNISYQLSEKLEQAYGLPEATDDDVMHVGFNRSLNWLTAVRYAVSPGIDSTDHSLSRFHSDIVAYIAFCTSKADQKDGQRAARLMESPDALSTITGIGFDSQWDTFPYYSLKTLSDDTQHNEACGTGIGEINTYMTTSLYGAVASAVAVPMGFSGTNTAQAEATNAWQIVGASQDDAARFYANGIINDALTSAKVNVPIAGSMETANALMVDTANAQRASAFAGSESLFRSMIRPMMAFFESLVYIAAPFMVLVIGLGGMGIKLIGRYTLATVWVSMWMPTLAAVNLYQETMATEAIGPFLHAPPSSTGAAFHAMSSLFGSHMAYGQLDNLVATGALLAASTPAITAFLLFGSVQALNGLMGSMQGGSSINPKMAVADPTSTPATTNRSALHEYNAKAGMSDVGGIMPESLSFGSAQSLGQAQARQAGEKSMRNFSTTYGSQASSAISSYFGKEGSVGGSASALVNDQVSKVQAAAASQGYQIGFSEGYGLVANSSANTANTASISESGGANFSGTRKGRKGGETGGASPGSVLTGGVAASSGSSAGSSSLEQGGHNSDHNLSGSRARSLSTNDAVQAAVIGAQQSMVSYAAKHGSQEAQALMKSVGYSDSASQTSTLGQTFAETGTASSNIGADQVFKPSDLTAPVATFLAGNDSSGNPNYAQAAGMAVQQATDAGVSRQRIDELKGAYIQSGGMDSNRATIAAAMVAMHDPYTRSQEPKSDSPEGAHAAQVKQDAMQSLVEMLSGSRALTVDVGGAAGVSPHQGSLGADAGAAAGTKGEVMAQGRVNAGQIGAAVHGGAGASPSSDAAAAASFGGMGSDYAAATAGGERAGNNRSPDGTVSAAGMEANHPGVGQHAKDSQFDQFRTWQKGHLENQQNNPVPNTDTSLGIIDTIKDAVSGDK